MPPDDAPAATLPPRWVRPALLVTAWTLLLAAGANVFPANGLPALGFILAPVLLFYALFCARRGVERGYAAETGMLPGLLLFGGLMFAAGPLTRFVPYAPGLCLLLLAAFATARVDPPAPPGARLFWALLAGVFGVWCAYTEPRAWADVGALFLYAGWSAWRGVKNDRPVPPARRITGMWLFVSLIAVPAASRFDVEFLIVPLCVTAGLILLDLSSPVLKPANGLDPLP